MSNSPQGKPPTMTSQATDPALPYHTIPYRLPTVTHGQQSLEGGHANRVVKSFGQCGRRRRLDLQTFVGLRVPDCFTW